MRALVLGGSGFLGRALVKALVGADHEVVLGLREVRGSELPAKLERRPFDLAAPGPWDSLLEGIEVVFHLAWSGGPERAHEDPGACYRVDVEGSLRLLASLRRAPGTRLVFPSSGGTLYGPVPDAPAREERPVSPAGPYAIHKWLVERHLLAALPGPRPDVRILRIANVYGPSHSPRPAPGVVAALLRADREGIPAELWGEATQRDYVYLDDVVRALVRAGELPPGSLPEGRVLNIGSGRGISLRTLRRSLEEALGRDLPCRLLPARPRDLARSVLDVRAAAEYLGWHPEVGLEEGLRRTLAASPSSPGEVGPRRGPEESREGGTEREAGSA